MRYKSYQQGNDITLDGLKYHLRIVDNTHDAELAILLKSATIFTQEYFGIPLANCTVVQEHHHADTSYTLYLTNASNIRVTDWNNNEVSFTQIANNVLLDEAKTVRITYDCTPIEDSDRYAQIVYQIAGANYDGQPEQIANILRNYPVVI